MSLVQLFKPLYIIERFLEILTPSYKVRRKVSQEMRHQHGVNGLTA